MQRVVGNSFCPAITGAELRFSCGDLRLFGTNDSYASLDGSQITGSQHGGLVAVNFSTIGIGSSSPPTVVGVNGADLFCDSKSIISGAANISNANTTSCVNLLAGDNETIP